MTAAQTSSRAKASAGYKGRHHIGSVREQFHRLIDAKSEESAIAYALKKGKTRGTALAWARTFRKSRSDIGQVTIRDLQKLSSETILALHGPTPITSGNKTVALLVPLKPPDPRRLRAALKLAEEMAKSRDPAEDDAVLVAMGIDPTNWSDAAVRKLQDEWLAMK